MDPIHAALLQKMLGGPGGPPGAGPGGPPGANGGPAGPPPQNGEGMDPLHAVQSVIQDIHDLMRLLPDPQAVSVAATALKAFTGLQQQMMTQGPQGAGKA